MTRTHASTLLALGLALASPALGADPKAAPEAKPAAPAKPAGDAATKPAAPTKPSGDAPTKPAADELARVLMPKSTWDAGMKALAGNVEQRLQAHPGQKLQVPADFPAKVRSELDAALPYDALLGIHAKQLSASYSDGELKELLAFYRSPVGQKSLQVMPQITEKVSAETQQRIESKMPQIMERLSSMVKAPAGGGQGMPAGHPSMGAPPPPASKPAKQGK